MSFEKLVEKRYCGIEGVTHLLWPKEDKGGFGNKNDGPLCDWMVDSKSFMKYCKKKEVVISAGGNCGMYVRFYKNYFENVYTFEPDDLNFFCLDINCQGDGYHKFHGALGNSNDKLSLVKNFSNCGMSRIQNIPGNVQIYKIDDLELKSCDLIHLDVEGFEEEALMGSLQTINKYWPVIVAEYVHGFDGKILKDLGYKMVEKLRMDCVFIK